MNTPVLGTIILVSFILFFTIYLIHFLSNLKNESVIDKKENKEIITVGDKRIVVKDNIAETNGVKIEITDEEIKKIKDKEKKEQNKNFSKSKKELLSKIRDSIEICDNVIDKKVLIKLLKHPLETKEDFDRLTYIYNSGNLRSNEDVRHFDHYVKTKKERESFNNERHKVNVLAVFIPFITVFFIVFIKVGFPLFGVPLGLLAGGFAGYIGMIIGYNINISNAKYYCIPDDDPRVIDEKRKRAVGIASGIASGISIGRHAKSNAKELLEPDSWKEMK